MSDRSLLLDAHGAQLVKELGGLWRNGQGLCLCPAHDDHNPSLSIRVGERALLFKCFAGCDTVNVLRAIRRMHLSLPDSRRPEPSMKAKRVEATFGLAQRLWNASLPLNGSLAHTYLSSRLLKLPWHDLRYNARTPLGRARAVVFRPAMVAAVREGNRISAVHRTFIEPGTASKARDLAASRMMLGRPGRGAVQLAPAASLLGLAEGIETALAAMQLHGIPVWATLGTERAGHLLLPRGLARLILLFDRDAAGLEADRQARLAYQRPGLEIESLWPPAPHNDWAEVLLARSQIA